MQGLKIKNRSHLHKTLPLAFLLVAAFLFLPHQSFCQDSLKKTYPDGTTGLVLDVGPDDYLAKSKKPWNEFEGTYSTFRFGLGYILDGAAYSQNSVFKKQMDSAGLALNSNVETRDFRIMASGAAITAWWKNGRAPSTNASTMCR